MSEKMIYIPIDCELYDYIEIACMKGYLLDIELIGGKIVTGKAITIRVTPNKAEWLIISQNQVNTEIRLDTIRSINPPQRDALFGRILFR